LLGNSTPKLFLQFRRYFYQFKLKLTNFMSNKPSFFFLIFISFFLSCQSNLKAHIQFVDVSYFSENLSVTYDSELLFSAKIQPDVYLSRTNRSQVEAFYRDLNSKNYQGLLENLQVKKVRLELNDWLYYELMKKSVDAIFYKYSKNHRTLVNWFLLSKSGYDARITYLKNTLFLNIYTTDELFEIPIIIESGRPLANLSSIHNETRKSIDMLYVCNYVPNRRGKNFSFDLEKLPILKQKITQKTIKFETRESAFEIEVAFDETMVDLMRHYPFFAEHKYLEVPMSTTLSNSLIPIIKQITAGKPWKESLEIIASLTRTGFAYKTDEEVYGKSKPMITEEIFHYKWSDCEDRSALFYSIVKEVIQFPMIAIAFSDHITIAVSTPTPIGDTSIEFQGKKYYICDPTGPIGSFEIGDMPSEYKRKKFEIICHWK
jgi:hypothetical protein